MSSTDKDRSAGLHRVDGRLHAVHHLKDEAGQLIGTVVKPLKVEFRSEDFGQLLVGAFLMALPMAFTGEVWDLVGSLSGARVLTIFVVSLLTLALFIWTLFYAGEGGGHTRHFFRRVVSAYLVTFFVALFLLILIDQAPLDDLRVALSRTIIVAFPASFSATAIDFVK